MKNWLGENIHEIMALVVLAGWVFTWYYPPAIPYAQITSVLTLILGYFYGKSKPQA